MIASKRTSGGSDATGPWLVLDIGNSFIHLGIWESTLTSTLQVALDRIADLDAALEALKASLVPPGLFRAVLMSSVAPHATRTVGERIKIKSGIDPLLVGESIDLPMKIALDDAQSVGTDRLCASAAAFAVLQRSCTVIAFGTAVTVDLVDEKGTFMGGAILPGIGLQFRVLHEQTAQLPMVQRGLPEGAYGRSTVGAIQTGVCRGLAGAVRGITEGYATALNHWPHVIATGGDAEFMAPCCDFVDTWMPHLALRGVAFSYERHIAGSRT